MNKIFLIICTTLLISACGEKKYSVYSCPTSSDAERCNEKCSNSEKLDLKYSFSTSSDLKEVMMVAFVDDKQVGSLLKKECSIFSETKWDCSRSYGNSNSTYKLVGGIFTMYTSAIEPSSTPNRSTCAK
jgi:hypothetical protein